MTTEPCAARGPGKQTVRASARASAHGRACVSQIPVGRESLERLLDRAAKEKLTALAWNRDPREIKTHLRSQSARAQSALGRKPAEERVFRPALRHLADRVGTRLRAKSRPGGTVTVRVRFADLHSVTRSVTLDTPISATAILAEMAWGRRRGGGRGWVLVARTVFGIAYMIYWFASGGVPEIVKFRNNCVDSRVRGLGA
jgi:nucleotidyltransferase/DNA polymerase involved in DNA repair